MSLLTNAIPLPWRIGMFCSALVAAWAWGYSHRDSAADAENSALEAVAQQTDTKYRKLEKDAADAQQAYLHVWTARNAESERLLAQARSRVAARMPAIHAECHGAGTSEGAGLEQATGTLTAGDAADAFTAGSALEKRLELCQRELQECSSLTR